MLLLFLLLIRSCSNKKNQVSRSFNRHEGKEWSISPVQPQSAWKYGMTGRCRFFLNHSFFVSSCYNMQLLELRCSSPREIEEKSISPLLVKKLLPLIGALILFVDYVKVDRLNWRGKKNKLKNRGSAESWVAPVRWTRLPPPFFASSRLFDDSNEFITQPIGIHHAQTFFFRRRYCGCHWTPWTSNLSRGHRVIVSRGGAGGGRVQRPCGRNADNDQPVVMRFTWHTSINEDVFARRSRRCL